MDAKIQQLQSMSQSNPNLIAITHCHTRDKLVYLQKFIERITKAGFTLVPLSKSGRYYVPKSYECYMSYLQSIILGIIQGRSFSPSALPPLSLGAGVSPAPVFQNITLKCFCIWAPFAVLLYYRNMLWEMTLSMFTFKDKDSKHRSNRMLVFT